MGKLSKGRFGVRTTGASWQSPRTGDQARTVRLAAAARPGAQVAVADARAAETILRVSAWRARAAGARPGQAAIRRELGREVANLHRALHATAREPAPGLKARRRAAGRRLTRRARQSAARRGGVGDTRPSAVVAARRAHTPARDARASAACDAASPAVYYVDVQIDANRGPTRAARRSHVTRIRRGARSVARAGDAHSGGAHQAGSTRRAVVRRDARIDARVRRPAATA